MSVLGLIRSSYPYLRSAMVRFPLWDELFLTTKEKKCGQDFQFNHSLFLLFLVFIRFCSLGVPDFFRFLPCSLPPHSTLKPLRTWPFKLCRKNKKNNTENDWRCVPFISLHPILILKRIPSLLPPHLNTFSFSSQISSWILHLKRNTN